MADKTSLESFGDPSKINLYGASEEGIRAYQDSLEQGLKALESRYDQPNWFKVAAGFAKPQLGGFLASLGSAADAMGENVEKQREQQLPVSQMRAQLAQSKILMGQNQKATEIVLANPGVPTDAILRILQATAPDAPATKAYANQLTSQKAEEDLQLRKQLG